MAGQTGQRPPLSPSTLGPSCGSSDSEALTATYAVGVFFACTPREWPHALAANRLFALTGNASSPENAPSPFRLRARRPGYTPSAEGATRHVISSIWLAGRSYSVFTHIHCVTLTAHHRLECHSVWCDRPLNEIPYFRPHGPKGAAIVGEHDHDVARFQEYVHVGMNASEASTMTRDISLGIDGKSISITIGSHVRLRRSERVDEAFI